MKAEQHEKIAVRLLKAATASGLNVTQRLHLLFAANRRNVLAEYRREQESLGSADPVDVSQTTLVSPAASSTLEEQSLKDRATRSERAAEPGDPTKGMSVAPNQRSMTEGQIQAEQHERMATALYRGANAPGLKAEVRMDLRAQAKRFRALAEYRRKQESQKSDSRSLPSTETTTASPKVEGQLLSVDRWEREEWEGMERGWPKPKPRLVPNHKPGERHE